MENHAVFIWHTLLGYQVQPYCLTDRYVYFILSVGNLIDFLLEVKNRFVSISNSFQHSFAPNKFVPFEFSFEIFITFCLVLSNHMHRMNSFNICSLLDLYESHVFIIP